MLRKSKKSLAILLTLAMLATLFVGVPTASAASTYSVLSTPTVNNDDTYQGLSTIQIDFDQLEAKKHTLLITLPKDYVVDFTAAANSPVLSVVKSGNGTTTAGQFSAGTVNAGVIKISDREFKVELDTSAVGPDYDVRLLLTLPSVLIPASEDGEVKAILTNLAGNFSSGELVVGNATSGAITVYVNDVVTFSNDGTTGNAIEINLKENVKEAIKTGEAEAVKIKLPKGMTWSGIGTITNVNAGVASTDLTPSLSTDSRTLIIARSAVSTEGKSIFRVANDIKVDESQANFGDVEVSISGKTTSNVGTLKIGEYIDYGVKAVVVGSVPSVKPGRLAQEIADFNIEENAKASVLNNRSVTLTLPAGAKWSAIGSVTPTGGLSVISGPASVGTDGRKVKVVLGNTGAAKGKVKFENVEVDLAVDFTGDLVVTMEGAGLEKTELTVAESLRALTGTANSPDVKIGVQNQAAGTIQLVEGYKEALLSGKDLVLTLPSGVEWSALPTVNVIEGDLDVDNDGIAKNNRVLTIPIKGQSAIASTIEISNVKLTVDRTVPEGPMEIEVQGDAIDEVNDGTGGTAYTFYTANALGIFPQNDIAATVVGAKCVTPAPGEEKSDVSFTIGSTTYTANGVEQTMDVAPYIKDSRTYMPLRYVAMALGVAEQNIMWDAAAQTATLIKGDKVVQVKIGSTVMLVNGISINMDVAPEISSDRTMLPLRWIGQAFGANFTWDDATQTATMNL